MIEILGNDRGSEYETAKKLKQLFLNKWFDLNNSQTDFIKIYVGLKLYGSDLEDIDIVIIGYFEEPREIDVEMNFYPRDHAPTLPRKVFINNFIWVIEDKEHDGENIRFVDKIVQVKYSKPGFSTWHNATEQNRDQMFYLQKYIRNETGIKLRMNNLIHLSSVEERDLPIQRPHNVITKDCQINKIFNMTGQLLPKPIINDNKIIFMSSEKKEKFKEFLDSDKVLNIGKPTSLDRKKMDNISKTSFDKSWLDDLGKKQVLIKGRGGVGKTIILLQMAFKSWDQKNERSLFLTFNNALVADLKRTMALLGIPKKINQGIEVRTVHSFFKSILEDFDLLNREDDFINVYEDKKDELVEFFKNEALNRSDFKNLMKEFPEKYWFDYIFIDEGQDWPENEIFLLNHFYKTEQIIIADGEDQYIRGEKAVWKNYDSIITQRTRKLTRCLRMKKNLASFVKKLAENFNLDEWDLEPNDEAGGGRVIIYEGNINQSENIYLQFKNLAMQQGNYPVDMLACVPPRLVDKNIKKSVLGNFLETKGYKVWDGTSDIIRKEFCKDRDELRIVQYDSCRGLEGWVVLNYEMDEFWKYKFNSLSNSGLKPDDLYTTDEEFVKFMTAKWMLIPLTRAMDTIVINVTSNSSVFKTELKKLSDELDFIEWNIV